MKMSDYWEGRKNLRWTLINRIEERMGISRFKNKERTAKWRKNYNSGIRHGLAIARSIILETIREDIKEREKIHPGD